MGFALNIMGITPGEYYQLSEVERQMAGIAGLELEKFRLEQIAELFSE